MQQLGSLSLFLGTETSGWSIAQFQSAARAAKTLGITSLLVKIADGLGYWYSSIGGWQQVITAINQAGLQAIPYMYCYGNASGSSVSGETAILANIMQTVGIVVADMEVEYNGQATWAQQVCAALKPVSGTFGVTSWGDPNEQNWTGVVQALAPCVNFWMPQVYTDYLAGVYQQEYQPYGLPVYPVLYLGSDLGPNNILQNAKNAASSPTIALWEYQSINTYASTIQAIAKPATPIVIPPSWTDDGTATLKAPNNVAVTGTFRSYILNPANKWDPNNYPLAVAETRKVLEIGNPSLGSGVRQVFRTGMLEQTGNGAVFVAWIGQELLAVEGKLSKDRDAFGVITTAIQNAL